MKISRREFLEKTGKGIVAATLLPAFLKFEPLKNLDIGKQSFLSLKDYCDLFNVDEKIISKAISVAIDKGGDYCDIYFQFQTSSFIAMEDNRVNRAFGDVILGAGIRVVIGDQTGYCYTEEITKETLIKAAQTASEIAKGTKKSKPVKLKTSEKPSYYKAEIKLEDLSVDKRMNYLINLNEKILSLDKRIVKTNIGLSAESNYIMVATSEGKILSDYQPMIYINARITAEQNGKKEYNGAALAKRAGFEALNEDNLNFIAKEAVDRTMILFDAIKPKAGEMEVVLAAGGSGILLHEAIGHGMEADFNRKGTSIFSDKIGKKVAENFVSIVDDGTVEGSRGAINFDDEGNESQKTFLVENGILKSYMHDYISAKYYKVKPTGNGRRESFKYYPLPRMRNTYMLPGPHKKEEIIESVKYGILCETFTNGQVLIGPGDFTFYVKNGYLIENGKITAPIKDVNIIGNGPKVLADISMVADDFKFDDGTWTCGKDGQSVPVSLGMPTVKVNSITVGGVN
jgi:TldD protein